MYKYTISVDVIFYKGSCDKKYTTSYQNLYLKSWFNILSMCKRIRKFTKQLVRFFDIIGTSQDIVICLKEKHAPMDPVSYNLPK